MEIGLVELDGSGRADRPDNVPLRHTVPWSDSDRAEV
jgi:hypothetical protein